ncbi:hypothetical protein [Brevibacillus brevis]|uniref:Uncharacterized protein n=1 Tax=Brevibacillus brevis TaxID=1393 RepID=A0ABY9T5U1_BREBE|nr:hypothetical protein [Brevibacillus brevis]WNC15470.1 hypothetical protein RGB73_03745 [Brevibacillus brevis]
MLRRFMLAFIALLCLGAQTASADVSVKGYFRKDGTYVKPHMRSNPDGNFWNNWSTKGNINPYTGEPGTKSWPTYTPSFTPYTPTLPEPTLPDFPTYSQPNYTPSQSEPVPPEAPETFMSPKPAKGCQSITIPERKIPQRVIPKRVIPARTINGIYYPEMVLPEVVLPEVVLPAQTMTICN